MKPESVRLASISPQNTVTSGCFACSRASPGRLATRQTTTIFAAPHCLRIATHALIVAAVASIGSSTNATSPSPPPAAGSRRGSLL